MKSVLPFLAVFLAGLITALEGATNGLVTKSAGSLYVALAIAFALSAVLLLAALPFVPFTVNAGAIRALPWYAWLAGAYTVATIALAAWATPKIGAGPALVAALVAQSGLGLVLDHVGALGLEQTPITWLKGAGILVMAAGAVMVAIRT